MCVGESLKSLFICFRYPKSSSESERRRFPQHYVHVDLKTNNNCVSCQYQFRAIKRVEPIVFKLRWWGTKTGIFTRKLNEQWTSNKRAFKDGIGSHSVYQLATNQDLNFQYKPLTLCLLCSNRNTTRILRDKTVLLFQTCMMFWFAQHKRPFYEMWYVSSRQICKRAWFSLSIDDLRWRLDWFLCEFPDEVKVWLQRDQSNNTVTRRNIFNN